MNGATIQSPKLPDPRQLVDSVGDNVLTAVQILPKTGANLASVLDNYASRANTHINEVKNQLPENLGIIPSTILGALGETVGAGIGLVEGFVKAGVDTAQEIKGNIERSIS